MSESYGPEPSVSPTPPTAHTGFMDTSLPMVGIIAVLGALVIAVVARVLTRRQRT